MRISFLLTLLAQTAHSYYDYKKVKADEFLRMEMNTLGPRKDLTSLVSVADFGNNAKAILIFNEASECGYTSQLEGLQAMYDKYHKDGFQILAFPSDDFNQEPRTDAEVHKFCEETYKTTFPIMTKINVNGEQTHPIFGYLKANALKSDIRVPDWNPLSSSGLRTRDIQWNFTKFLVTRSKQDNKLVIRRFNYDEATDLGSELEQLVGKAMRNPHNTYVVPHAHGNHPPVLPGAKNEL